MEKKYDAIIVGGGPAGLSAAIYLARAQFNVLVVERDAIGGQIVITGEVVNYPGILATNGKNLTADMHRQAENFGATFLSAEVTGLELSGTYKTVHTTRGDFSTPGIIYAAGAHPRAAGFKGEEDFKGHGVAYCATCDGEFFTDKDIFVVGGGFAAVEEGLFLTRYARRVFMVVRRDDFSIHSPAVDELKSHEKVTVLTHTKIKEVLGNEAIRSVILENTETGEEKRYDADSGDFCGVFVFTGYAPENKLIQGQVELDDRGYIITDRDQKTNLAGVYGAGDICVKNLRQVVTAVSDGAIAATSLEKYIEQLYRNLGIKREYKKVVIPKKEEKVETVKASNGSYLDDSTRQALAPVLARLANPITLRLYDDNSTYASENKRLIEELAQLSAKISTDIVAATDDFKNTIAIIDAYGNDMGMRFHGVPGGHEFNSFILALYNAAGPGQDVGEEIEKRIQSIKENKHIRLVISLTCTMCPDLVAAAERIAAGSPHVTVDVYDLQHYPAFKDKYNIMSVPCFMIDEGKLHFGKKSIHELLELLGV